MPNWVTTRINIINNDGTFSFKRDFQSFNDVEPMPEELKNTVSGSTSSSVKSYIRKFPTIAYDNKKILLDIIKLNDPEFYEEKYNQIDYYINCFQKYGHVDWYDWANENWGTKWDMHILHVDDDFIEFNTAWAFPAELIEKFASKFDKHEFFGEWAEEQLGYYTGTFDIADGTYNIEHDESDSKEAYERYFDIWGEDENYVFNEESNTYEYIDPYEDKS